MKKLLFMLLAVAAFAVACEKESSIQDPNIQNQLESPEESEEVVYPEIKRPADLPENIEDILINTPCWCILKGDYNARVTGDGIVIYNVSTEVGGEIFPTFKFNKNNELIYYAKINYPNIDASLSRKSTWHLDRVLKYSENEILYARTDPTIEGELKIMRLVPATQERLDYLLSMLTYEY